MIISESNNERSCGVFLIVILLMFLIFARDNLQASQSSSQLLKPDTNKVEIMDLETIKIVVPTFSGIAILLLQSFLQRRNEIKLQKENMKDEFKLNVFQKFQEPVNLAHDSLTKVNSFVLSARFNLIVFKKNPDQLHFLVDAFKANEFHEKHVQAVNDIFQVIRLIETNEVIIKDFDIFKIALISAYHDYQQSKEKLLSLFMDLEHVFRTAPTTSVEAIEQNMSTLSELETELGNNISTLNVYLLDLIVELQNKCLGHVFDNKVELRKPKDKKLKVVTTESSKITQIRKYFAVETPYAKENASVVAANDSK